MQLGAPLEWTLETPVPESSPSLVTAWRLALRVCVPTEGAPGCRGLASLCAPCLSLSVGQRGPKATPGDKVAGSWRVRECCGSLTLEAAKWVNPGKGAPRLPGRAHLAHTRPMKRGGHLHPRAGRGHSSAAARLLPTTGGPPNRVAPGGSDYADGCRDAWRPAVRGVRPLGAERTRKAVRAGGGGGPGPRPAACRASGSPSFFSVCRWHELSHVASFYISRKSSLFSCGRQPFVFLRCVSGCIS